jgi:TPR repeat protein
MRWGAVARLGICLFAAGASAARADEGERAFRAARYEVSAPLLLRGARSGRARDQAYLGYSYQYGLGVPKSYEEAATWYVCAAEQGEPHAQFFLGQLYDRGQGVAENPVEAGKWLDLAAAHAPADSREHWAAMRDIIGGKMTLDQLAEARRRAVAWAPSSACAYVSQREDLYLPTHKYSRREADGER